MLMLMLATGAVLFTVALFRLDARGALLAAALGAIGGYLIGCALMIRHRTYDRTREERLATSVVYVGGSMRPYWERQSSPALAAWTVGLLAAAAWSGVRATLAEQGTDRWSMIVVAASCALVGAAIGRELVSRTRP
jgi:hypothetical protein